MGIKVLVTATFLAWAAPAVAQAPAKEAPKSPPSPFTFAFKGFISGSLYAQDAVLLGAGQGALIAAEAGGPTGVRPQPAHDRLVLAGDVRQSRLNFSVKGPAVLGGAIPTGVVELDFFGGYSGGNFGDESVFPRLRLAYIDAAWPSSTLRVGQFHNLVIGFLPASAGHIGFPYAYGSGLVGWRSPGVTFLHKRSMGNVNVELGLQMNRNSWNDAIAAGGSGQAVCGSDQAPPAQNCAPYGMSFGEAGLPQFEARVALTSGTRPAAWPLFPAGDWAIFLSGHWDQKDISGVGASSPGGELTTLVAQGGARASIGPVHLMVHGWMGKNAGSLLGNLIQTQSATAFKDVNAFGAFAQVGYSLTDQLAVWAYLGTERPDEVQAIEAKFSRLQNTTATGMISYKDGPYALGLEWIHYWTRHNNAAAPQLSGTVSANQVISSVTYFF